MTLTTDEAVTLKGYMHLTLANVTDFAYFLGKEWQIVKFS